MVQEALTNAVKHAPDRVTSLQLQVDDGFARLVVLSHDVGARAPAAGADPVSHEEQPPGFGLVGMAERAEQLGGTVRAGREGDDWAVRCELPLRGVRPRLGPGSA